MKTTTTKYSFYYDFIDVKTNKQAYVLPFAKNSIMLIDSYSKGMLKSILNYLSKVEGVIVKKTLQSFNAVYTIKYQNENLLKIMMHGDLLRTVFYGIGLQWIEENFIVKCESKDNKNYLYTDKIIKDKSLNITFNLIKKLVQDLQDKNVVLEEVVADEAEEEAVATAQVEALDETVEDEVEEAVQEEVEETVEDEVEEVEEAVEDEVEATEEAVEEEVEEAVEEEVEALDEEVEELDEPVEEEVEIEAEGDEDEEVGAEPTIAIPFTKKFLGQPLDKQNKVDGVINHLAKYKGVRYSLSSKAISLFYKRDLLLKIRFVGKRMFACYNLEYETLVKKYYTKVEDKKSYANCKTVQKLGSPRSYNFAKSLIDVLVKKYGLVENPKYEEINFVQILNEKQNVLSQQNLEEMPKSHIGYKIALEKDKHEYDFGKARSVVVCLEDIQDKFDEGEIVSVETLELNGLIESAKNVKIKISTKGGEFDKKLSFIINRVTLDAAKQILLKDGKITILE